MDDDEPRAWFTGLGNKVIPPVFKPLKCGPTIHINYKDSIAMEDLEELDPEYKEVIGQRVLKLS